MNTTFWFDQILTRLAPRTFRTRCCGVTVLSISSTSSIPSPSTKLTTPPSTQSTSKGLFISLLQTDITSQFAEWRCPNWARSWRTSALIRMRMNPRWRNPDHPTLPPSTPPFTPPQLGFPFSSRFGKTTHPFQGAGRCSKREKTLLKSDERRRKVFLRTQRTWSFQLSKATTGLVPQLTIKEWAGWGSQGVPSQNQEERSQRWFATMTDLQKCSRNWSTGSRCT